MKIVLVETMSTHINVYTHVPIPRVGSILLATLATQHGHDAKAYFEQKEPLDMDDILSADLVGISTLTMTAQRSYDLADRCRENGTPVVLGGIHASFLPKEALAHCDFVLRGEAEGSFLELLQALQNKGDPSGIPGISFWKDGKVFHTPERPFEKNLDKYPIPDWRLLAGRAHQKYPVVSISTARGCPHDCSFCTVRVFNGEPYRFHSVERVLEEIDTLRSQNPEMRYLFFADDIFNYDRVRAKAIIRGMIENGLHKGILWGAQMRHEASRHEELLDLMSRSNCDRAFVGFESVNQASLDRYGKKEKVADVINAIKSFHNRGAHWEIAKVGGIPIFPLRKYKRRAVRVHGMFMAGSDEDTVSDIRYLSRFVRKMGVDSFQLMVTTPNPGSRDYNTLIAEKRPLLSQNWDHFDGHHVVHAPAKIKPYELQVETVKAMKAFYSLPGVIKSLIKRDVLNAALRFLGRKHVRQWSKDPENRAYIKSLKTTTVA